MSYFEDCIEPYIGRIPYCEDRLPQYKNILNGDVIEYPYVAMLKETEKAYLFSFGSNGSAWVPKAMIDSNENNILSIYEEFRPKYIDKVKTIGIGDIC